MAQRGNVILVARDMDGKVKVRIYEDRWGIGKQPFMSLMDMCIQVFAASRQLNATTFKLDHLENLKRTNTFEYSKETGYDGNDEPRSTGKFIPALKDYYTPAGVQKINDRLLFNSNGGIVIYVEEKRGLFYGTDVRVSYALFLGYEDAYCEYDFGNTKEVFNKENKSLGRPGDKFLTVEEYAKMKTNSLFNRSGFNKTFSEFEKS